MGLDFATARIFFVISVCALVSIICGLFWYLPSNVFSIQFLFTFHCRRIMVKLLFLTILGCLLACNVSAETKKSEVSYTTFHPGFGKPELCSERSWTSEHNLKKRFLKIILIFDDFFVCWNSKNRELWEFFFPLKMLKNS